MARLNASSLVESFCSAEQKGITNRQPAQTYADARRNEQPFNNYNLKNLYENLRLHEQT